MGHDRLSAGAGGGDPGHRLGGRPLRCQANVDVLDRPLRHWVVPVRHGLVGQLPHCLSGPPGPRRRHAPPDRPSHIGPRRRAPAHGARHERRWGANGARTRARPGTRRPHPLELLVALDLLHQRADRHRHADLELALPRRHQGSRKNPQQLRRTGLLPAVPRPGRLDLLALRSRHDRQLHQHAGGREFSLRPHLDGGLRAPCAADQEPATRVETLQEPQLHHCQHLRLRAWCHLVRVNVLVAPLLPDRPGAEPARRGIAHGPPRHRQRPA